MLMVFNDLFTSFTWFQTFLIGFNYAFYFLLIFVKLRQDRSPEVVSQVPDVQKHPKNNPKNVQNKYKYDLLKTKNGIKPLIKNNFNKNQIYMIKNNNGQPLIFNMNLIHGGAINKSKNCRISIEFEFFCSI